MHYNADQNAIRVSHFRHDVALALAHGSGDPATLRAMHDQADQDLRHWDAKAAEMGALESALRKKALDDCTQRRVSDAAVTPSTGCLAYEPSTGAVVIARSDGVDPPPCIRIDASTGTLSPVGAVPTPSCLGYDADAGSLVPVPLHGATSRQCVEIDAKTGTLSPVGAVPLPSCLGYDADSGSLVPVPLRGAESPQCVEIDARTGTLSPVGAVPSPGTAAVPGEPAPAPKYNFGIGASYLYQRLPANSGELGVIGVGGAEQELLRNPRELDGWSIDLWNTVWNVGPEHRGLRCNAVPGRELRTGRRRSLQLDRQRSRPRERHHVVDEQNGSSGISSPGSNPPATSSSTTRRSRSEAASSGTFRAVTTRYDDEEGHPSAVRFALPTTIVETGIGVHYNEQDARQQFFMGNPNPGFELFDVRTRNQIESVDWSILGNFGVQEVLPIPGVADCSLTAGADVGLGYYRTRADADQWNRCDIRFAAVPGVNQCARTRASACRSNPITPASTTASARACASRSRSTSSTRACTSVRATSSTTSASRASTRP